MSLRIPTVRKCFKAQQNPETSNADCKIIIQRMKLPELEQSVRDGRIVPDKKICLNDSGELAVTKFAVEPVWYLPGVAERFGIGMTFIRTFEISYRYRHFLKAYAEAKDQPDEGALRRSLFENTGGSFPELITRGDIKLFLPRKYFQSSHYPFRIYPESRDMSWVCFFSGHIPRLYRTPQIGYTDFKTAF